MVFVSAGMRAHLRNIKTKWKKKICIWTPPPGYFVLYYRIGRKHSCKIFQMRHNTICDKPTTNKRLQTAPTDRQPIRIVHRPINIIKSLNAERSHTVHRLQQCAVVCNVLCILHSTTTSNRIPHSKRTNFLEYFKDQEYTLDRYDSITGRIQFISFILESIRNVCNPDDTK